MNLLLKLLQKIFKEKKVDFTDDDAKQIERALKDYEKSITESLSDKDSDDPDDIDLDIELPDVNHNSKVINQITATMKKSVASLQKQHQKSVSDLKNENATLKDEINKLMETLGEESKRREEGQKRLEEKQKKEQEAKIQKLLNEAVSDGRIPAKNDDVLKDYKEILESDYDRGERLLSGLPKTQSPGDHKKIDGKDDDKPTPSALASAVNPGIAKRLTEQKELAGIN